MVLLNRPEDPWGHSSKKRRHVEWKGTRNEGQRKGKKEGLWGRKAAMRLKKALKYGNT